MLSLVLSIISILLSITLFVVSQYRQLYRLGIATGKIYFSQNITTTGQEKQIMFVEISIINESQTPAIITNLTITEKELQEYGSDSGELIDEPIQVETKTQTNHQVYDKYTSTLPIVIPPYASFKGVFAFYQPWIFRQGHFLELETPKRFLMIPFNPNPETHTYSEERHNRYRGIKFYWRQNLLRTCQNKFLTAFTKRTWRLLTLRIKTKLSKIFSNFKRHHD